MPKTKKLSATVANPEQNCLPENFEQAMNELESLVQTMENGKMPLEDMLSSYQRGAHLVAICRNRLSQIEQQVHILDGDLLRVLDTPALSPENALSLTDRPFPS